MKLAIALSLVLFGAACKTDNAASSESAGAAESNPKGRNAKIDPLPNRPMPRLESDDDDKGDDKPTDADREARSEERRKDRLEALDKDGNGELSPEEVALGRKQRTEEMRTRMDKNGDGKVTVEELSDGRMGRRIDPAMVDTDKNGDISAEELQAGMQKMREQTRAQRGADGPPGGWGGGRWGGAQRGERGGSDTPKVDPKVE